ncbi:MAG TPA: penicillin-binding transpeptidase domain-containing protein [Solirubrobacteraceae bacterium]|nr:penicillin-binding transpeptidase domain-containing protein [Solirubrobacteraceae bacterium]
MNRPIVRLYGLVVVLFAVLVAFTSRWAVFEASSLRANALNKRGVLEQQRIDRGEIVAADGTVLARSVRGAEGNYKRVYPTGSLFTHAVGYSFFDLGQAGTELYRSAPLDGQNRGSVQSVLDQLQGRKPSGEEVRTALRPAAQRVAVQALGEHEGAVVALQPRTGAVEVMASTPGYDANSLSSASAYGRLTRDPRSPLVNRATQFGYAPGSTFKVVTAVAAIDSGRFTPESTVSGRNEVPISGVPLKNDNNDSLGQITLTEGLVHSVNTVYAQVAEQLGKPTMARYMSRFGFDRKPHLDYPSDQTSASGEYLHGRLIAPTSEYVDVGRMGIGQDKLQVTPLQMAEVAAAVANRGVLMAPHLASAIVEPDGNVVERISPKVQSVVMRSSTAAAVTTMMEAVVNEGTGVSAQIPGVRVAGKTGTAETQIGAAINNVWFIAFAPAQNPTAAVAVTLKGVPGQGGAFAAPVAKQVIEALLHE